jgi:hypothetical protein
MFEKIILRRSEPGPGLSLGDVAEALLFYEKVHVILDVWSIKTLIDSLGTRELLALIARKRITAFYAEGHVAHPKRSRGKHSVSLV